MGRGGGKPGRDGSPETLKEEGLMRARHSEVIVAYVKTHSMIAILLYVLQVNRNPLILATSSAS